MKKISEDLKLKIIAEYKTSNISVHLLELKYNVSRPTILDILRKAEQYEQGIKRWKLRLKDKETNKFNIIFKNYDLLNQVKCEYEKFTNIKVIAQKYFLKVEIVNQILFEHFKFYKRTSGETWHLQHPSKQKTNFRKKFRNYVSDVEIEKIIDSYKNSGDSYKTIAIKMGISKRTVCAILKQNHILRNNKSSRMLNKRIKESNQINEIIQNLSLCDKIVYDYTEKVLHHIFIAKTYSLKRIIVRKILERLGIKIRTAKETQHLKLHKALKTKFGPIKLYEYNGQRFQGSYEIRFAAWLTSKKMKFRTHGNIEFFKYVDNNNVKHTYFPDFYVEDWNTYIDTKGYVREKDLLKHKLVSEQNPTFNFKIFAKDELIEPLKIFGTKIQTAKELQKYEVKTLVQYSDNAIPVAGVETGKLI
jgi:transposase